jgi:hypothetical protein
MKYLNVFNQTAHYYELNLSIVYPLPSSSLSLYLILYIALCVFLLYVRIGSRWYLSFLIYFVE